MVILCQAYYIGRCNDYPLWSRAENDYCSKCENSLLPTVI
nr:MAG TPA: hypothetical protein [Caudoviricetes sp.]